MKRTVLIVLSIVLFLGSIPVIITGLALTAWGAGDDPSIKGRIGEVNSLGYAVVSDTLEVEWDSPLVDNSALADRFDLTIGVSSIGTDKPLFIGYGPSEAVDSYLAGVPYTLVFGIGDQTRTERDVDVPGEAAPQPPDTQEFWVQQSSGSGLQQISMSAQTGNFRVVAMNADGSAGVSVSVYGSVRLPFLTPVGIGLLILGGMLGLLGFVLLILGIRSKPQSPPPGLPVAAPNGYPAASQPVGPYPNASGPPAPPPAGPPPNGPPAQVPIKPPER